MPLAFPPMTTLDTAAAVPTPTQALPFVGKEEIYPSTSRFPIHPHQLERATLESHYLNLRRNYKGLMISRGSHRERSLRQRRQLHDLQERLHAMAAREASAKREAYEVLEIITDLVSQLEADGDRLTIHYQEYKGGPQKYNGGARIGSLIQAVIQFVNNWQGYKQQLRQLAARHQLVTAALSLSPGSQGQAA
jgi:hypothetical protein